MSKLKFHVSQISGGIRPLADLIIESKCNSKFGPDSKKFSPSENVNIVDRAIRYENGM